MDWHPWENFKGLLGLDNGNEVVESTEGAFKDRLASPFYGYFVLSWLLVNWKIPYAAFFLDQSIIQQKTGLLRNEYVESLFPQSYSWTFMIYFIALPFVLTVLTFWVFPFITRFFFQKNIRNKIALQVIELKERNKVTKQKRDVVKEDTALLVSEAKRAKEFQKIAEDNPEIGWEREFKNFRSSRLYFLFKQIVDTVYSHNGYVQDGAFSLDREMLVYTDSNGLTRMVGINKIELTGKGKYFVKRYSEDKAGVKQD